MQSYRGSDLQPYEVQNIEGDQMFTVHMEGNPSEIDSQYKN
jgi:hypothetical protein